MIFSETRLRQVVRKALRESLLLEKMKSADVKKVQKAILDKIPKKEGEDEKSHARRLIGASRPDGVFGRVSKSTWTSVLGLKLDQLGDDAAKAVELIKAATTEEEKSAAAAKAAEEKESSARLDAAGEAARKQVHDDMARYANQQRDKLVASFKNILQDAVSQYPKKDYKAFTNVAQNIVAMAEGYHKKASMAAEQLKRVSVKLGLKGNGQGQGETSWGTQMTTVWHPRRCFMKAYNELIREKSGRKAMIAPRGKNKTRFTTLQDARTSISTLGGRKNAEIIISGLRALPEVSG